MKINPDKLLVKHITEELERNGGYCPCSIEQTDDFKCVCKNMRENNECVCGLFVV